MSSSAPGAGPPVVPGYRLEALLGRGGSGEVWRAVPRGGGAAVAVKLLVAGDPERQAREAALLGRLDHPHLVRLHEVVHQPTRGGVPRVALVLDLLDGGSLASLLVRRGRLRPGEVVTAVSPVAAALAHAHEQGVVHGDLSPANIVFTAEGRPVLTDLGVARVLGEESCGDVTPAYVDPTVARGGAAGPASDVFGVAAAAFHALTGVAPWNAARPDDTLAVAAAGELPDLDELAPDAPPDLRAVIARGLAADPADRGSAAAFALDLRSACRPEPVRLPRVGVPDEELGRTGRGPRTELTHQVRRPERAATAAPDPDRRGRLVAALRWPTVSPAARRAVVLVAVAVVAGGLAWAGSRWAGGGGAASAAAHGGGAPASRASAAPPAARGSPAVSPPSGSASRPPPSSGAATVPAADRSETPVSAEAWQALVTELYGRRAQAFATGSGALLSGVYTPDSPALADDARAVGELAASHRQVQGFAPRVVRVDGVTVTGDTAVLRLVDDWAGYRVVAASGAPPGNDAASSVPARAEQSVRMTLTRSVRGWRIASVVREG